jgi:mono/diheme cytochrome c family protein
MNKRIFPLISILLLIALAGTFLAACGSSTSATTSANGGGSSQAGQTLMQTRCIRCHSISRVISAHHTAAEWKLTVDRMISKGAQLSPQEEQTLITYLAQNYK